MSSPAIEDLAFDDENEEKMGRHGITPTRALQILDNEHVIVPNRRSRRGAFLVIGRDNGGAFLSVPVEATRDEYLWRPITAWPSKQHEIVRLRQDS
jgi:hypothetical protein